MTKRSDIVAEARRIAGGCRTWADLSNALFDPVCGLVIRRFPGASARKAFRGSKAYGELRALVQGKMRETGVVQGSVATKSGRFVVRLPKSLHAALEGEAAAEGTSLNQLVLAKLAVQLRTATRSRPAAKKTRVR